MIVYYINLLLILALAYPLCIYKPCKIKSAVYLLLTFGWMWFIATFRYGIGWDYLDYIYIFEQVRGLNTLDSLLSASYEPGFVFLTRAMTFFIHDHTVMYGVYQILILLPVMWFIYRYCKNAWLPTWLYATLTFFYITMNFTRQALACSVSLLGYKFLRERKPVPYMLIVLLAASFHVTALIMIPIYFLCNIRMTRRLAIFYGASVIIAYATFEHIVDIITRVIFIGYADSIHRTISLPFRYLFVPIMILATCLTLLRMWEKRDKDAVMLTNMMLFSSVIWLFGTIYMIIERLSMYPYILLLAALPAALEAIRPTDEDYAGLEALKAQKQPTVQQKKKKKTDTRGDIEFRIAEMARALKDREVYYWSAVAAVIIITLIYHTFGVNMEFHLVFPYQSVLEWPWL